MTAPEPTAEQLALVKQLIDGAWDKTDDSDDFDFLLRNTLASALAAAVHAEREKYLRVADQCDVEATRERQYFTQRLDEGNEPAALVCTGMSVGWEHAARRIREVAG